MGGVACVCGVALPFCSPVQRVPGVAPLAGLFCCLHVLPDVGMVMTAVWRFVLMPLLLFAISLYSASNVLHK